MRYILFSLMLFPSFIFAAQDPLMVEVDAAIQILTIQQQRYQNEVNNSVSQPKQTKNFNSLLDYPALSSVHAALGSKPQGTQTTNEEMVKKIDTIKNKIQKLQLIKMDLENNKK